MQKKSQNNNQLTYLKISSTPTSGRVCITAAREYGARAVGIEIDAGAVAKAHRLVKEAGVEKLVDINLGRACHSSPSQLNASVPVHI
jgi:Ni2+-binding GTPase involved in maturation of urease and hydrogenase